MTAAPLLRLGGSLEHDGCCSACGGRLPNQGSTRTRRRRLQRRRVASWARALVYLGGDAPLPADGLAPATSQASAGLASADTVGTQPDCQYAAFLFRPSVGTWLSLLPPASAQQGSVTPDDMVHVEHIVDVPVPMMQDIVTLVPTSTQQDGHRQFEVEEIMDYYVSRVMEELVHVPQLQRHNRMAQYCGKSSPGA